MTSSVGLYLSDIFSRMMNKAQYKLAKQVGGVGHFSEVHLERCNAIKSDNISVAEDAFSWLREWYGPDAWEWSICDEYRDGAIKGVKYGLANLVQASKVQDLGILITKVISHPAHGTGDSVAFAACMATWKLIGDDGALHPYFQDENIVFP